MVPRTFRERQLLAGFLSFDMNFIICIYGVHVPVKVRLFAEKGLILNLIYIKDIPNYINYVM